MKRSQRIPKIIVSSICSWFEQTECGNKTKKHSVFLAFSVSFFRIFFIVWIFGHTNNFRNRTDSSNGSSSSGSQQHPNIFSHILFSLSLVRTYYMPFSATYYARLLHFGWNESNQMSFSCFQVVSFVVLFYRCWLLRRSSLLRQFQIIIIIILITATTATITSTAAAAVSIITIIIYLFVSFFSRSLSLSYTLSNAPIVPSPNHLNIGWRNVNKSFRWMWACMQGCIQARSWGWFWGSTPAKISE